MNCFRNMGFGVLAGLFCFVFLAVGTGYSLAAPVDQTPILTLVSTIDLPGKGGHGDVVVYDPDKKTVYIAQSPDNNVIVISTVTNKVAAVIPDVNGGNGIAVGPSFIYAASGDDNTLAVIDKTTWKVIKKVPTGGTAPDAVYYDAQDDKVFVGNDDSNTMGVIYSQYPFVLITSFPLSSDKPIAGPDLGLYVAEQNRIYQSMDNLVLVINAATNEIIKTIPTNVEINKKGGTKSMIYDPQKNTLWVGTSSKQILAMNLDTGGYTKVATDSGMDQLTWDPITRLIFFGQGGAGALGIIDASTGKFLGSLKTEADFHTVAVDYDQHLVYAYYNQSNKVLVYKENTGMMQ
ncbi:Hypothetical protein LUCI_4327 [Lucifera butyrica]|uniref:Uncharacterized protein n=1 Tax=Lucifera butyrica TaxID=1351585 RepID=A0A498RCC3_9FIRM|nr:YncE family protein [Lucifera butyrica]VBB09041.1 Hypothetical protein LUCI_4327 [Lucifera butyrica]